MPSASEKSSCCAECIGHARIALAAEVMQTGQPTFLSVSSRCAVLAPAQYGFPIDGRAPSWYPGRRL